MTRVLVVEDEESYSDALAYMLRKEGFEVSLAATGLQAYQVKDTAFILAVNWAQGRAYYWATGP